MSSKEVERIKKLVIEKEREDRKNNIVIKAMDIEEVTKDKKEWAKEFLKERLRMEYGIVNVRISGPMIIVKIERVFLFIDGLVA